MAYGDITRQTAYTAEELVGFIADVYVRLEDTKVQEPARDALAAIASGIAEYGMNAAYISQALREAPAKRRKGTPPKTYPVGRNRERLAELGAEREAALKARILEQLEG